MMSIAYYLFGPTPLLFDRNFVLVCISLSMIGFSSALMYGNLYIVPLIPHMVEIAHLVYDYQEDDRLNDGIASVANIFMAAGEITGPIFGSYLPIYFGYRMASTVLAFWLSIFSINYAIFSDAFRNKGVKLP